MNYGIHPAASIFPAMSEPEYEALKADIAANGLREPIWLTPNGQVLDGRHRLRACQELGIMPDTVTRDEPDPVRTVISLNLHRRHLSPSQLAFVALEVEKVEASLAKERQLSALKQNASVEARMPERTNGRAREKAAESVGIGDRYVSDAKKIAQESPALAEEVKSGAKTIPQAIKEIKRTEIRAKLEDLADSEVISPTGKHDVIVIDPPWEMQKIERDVRPNQSEFDYPTMNESELCAMDVAGLAADDCHLFCWTTQKHLPAALRVISAWGFRYVLTMVWHKTGGFQPLGLPQYNCEFVIYARRGTPQFIDTKAFPCCFDGKRREHSRKPDEFYDVIRRVTAGRRIDIFSREPREGFTQHGNEIGRFAA